MDEEQLLVISLLQREPLFDGLDENQLAEISGYFRRIVYPRNTVIYSENSPPDAFFIVFNGKVRISKSAKKGEYLVNILGPGDYFGEQALVFNRLHATTAATIERTTLLRMEAGAFFQLVNEYPDIYSDLSIVAESHRLALKRKFNFIRPDEVVYFLSRKHPLFLITSLIWPAVLCLVSVPVLLLGLYRNMTPAVNSCLFTLGMLMFFFSILWAIWNAIDWGNDYYFVTNLRVIWLEKIIGLYESRTEAPLDTILAVNTFTELLGRWLDFGNASVRTYTGKIDMSHMRHPYAFEGFVKRYQRRYLVISKEGEARLMEEELDEALRRKIANPYEMPTIVSPIRSPAANAAPKAKPEGYWGQLRHTFLKVRFEQDGVITYRKHWLSLIRKCWIPLFILFVLLAISFGWGWFQSTRTEMIFSPSALLLCGGLVYGMDLIWLLYCYLDWNNDIYQVTPTHILDIERKPLGEELKKSAPLESILSVEHERANIIQNLFNYGYVTSNVGETKFVFRDVYNPGLAHQDIVDTREALFRKRRETEAAAERELMVKWLVTYYSQTADPEVFENPPNLQNPPNPQDPQNPSNPGEISG